MKTGFQIKKMIEKLAEEEFDSKRMLANHWSENSMIENAMRQIEQTPIKIKMLKWVLDEKDEQNEN